MGIITCNFQCHQSSLGSSSSGSVCYVSEPQAGHFRFSSSRSSSILSTQCQSLGKECSLTHSLPSGFFPKSFKRWLGNLARSFLLHRLGQNKPGSQICCIFCVQDHFFFLSEWIYCLSWKEKIMHPNPENLHLHAWLLSGRESDRKVFLLEQPTTSLRLSVRQSTEIVYDAKWSIFVNWCVGREIDPIKVSVQQLADFLYIFLKIKVSYHLPLKVTDLVLLAL
jgi:hypothetical protein